MSKDLHTELQNSLAGSNAVLRELWAQQINVYNLDIKDYALLLLCEVKTAKRFA
ncbi:MAG: hypothetical protein ACI8SE_001836 [Bacteroidia bacterium]|jgi:hypothetical protein